MISFNVSCHHPTIQSSILSQESNTTPTTQNDLTRSKQSRTYTTLPITLFQESNQPRKHSIVTKIITNTNTFYSLNHPLVAEFTSKNIIGRRLLLSTCVIISPATFLPFSAASKPSKTTTTTTTSDAIAKFYELPNSGGVKALDLRPGIGSTPIDGDQVAIHYYGRLAAKQGWRFDSTYDHKDSTGEPIPFIFILGSSNVISGIETAVRSMKEGGIRRVIIPPLQGYQTTTQEPLPPNYFDRQRLFTTIFNPTRLANGEGSTLGTLIFDIELVKVRHL